MGYDHTRYARKVGASIVIKDPEIANPQIVLPSGGGAQFKSGSGSNAFRVYYGPSELVCTIERASANVMQIEGGGVAGDTLILKANAIDAAPTITLAGGGDITLGPPAGSVVKFGAYTAGVAGNSTGYISIKDITGTARKLMVQA